MALTNSSNFHFLLLVLACMSFINANYATGQTGDHNDLRLIPSIDQPTLTTFLGRRATIDERSIAEDKDLETLADSEINRRLLAMTDCSRGHYVISNCALRANTQPPCPRGRQYNGCAKPSGPYVRPGCYEGGNLCHRGG
ncbi:hypothetical protein Ancab_013563 [Ancistrocladus abbreviatus]